jgi:predicted DNA-binding transcriptional regulator AlpA
MPNRGPRKPLTVPIVLHPQALLRLEQVQALVPIPTTSLYEEMRAGRFPKPVRISARTVAWRWSDIEPLLESFETVSDIDAITSKALAGLEAKRAQDTPEVTEEAPAIHLPEHRGSAQEVGGRKTPTVKTKGGK